MNVGVDEFAIARILKVPALFIVMTSPLSPDEVATAV